MIKQKILSINEHIKHSIVYNFQLKHEIFVKSRAKSVGVKWQESHFCQYRVMTKAIQLIYSILGLFIHLGHCL